MLPYILQRNISRWRAELMDENGEAKAHDIESPEETDHGLYDGWKIQQYARKQQETSRELAEQLKELKLRG